jgi:23S rRNA (cytosine1962-C5)-methyltransferase
MQAILHNNRLKTISRRHPWVFSGAIRRFTGQPKAGDLVTLASEAGEFLGRGMWNPASSIRMRVLTWQDEPINADFWRRRLQQAINSRGPIPPHQARRLVNAESDYLPGLIVDQYGEFVVLQALTPAIDQHKTLLAELLADLLQPIGIYERSDSEAREREQLSSSTGVLWGVEPPDLVEISEDEHRFYVDLKHGHKTGFYLDQRENRRVLADHLPKGARVLNTFCYTGAFSVYAYGAGAAEVLSVDSSEEVLALAEKNLALNGFEDSAVIAGDVFRFLRQLRSEEQQFDAIVLDPPKFAKNTAQVEAALRGYKDINLLALQLLRPGGLLLTCSCTGTVETELFRKVVFGALEDSGREAQVLRQLSAPPDHPVALTFPEGQYLKGLLCRVR